MGKPKEFFKYDFDQIGNVSFHSIEQMNFIKLHYPEYQYYPDDLLEWLYEMAEFRDKKNATKLQKNPQSRD